MKEEEFNKLTKAERQHLIEMDYLQRKMKEEFQLKERQKRLEKWHKIGMAIWGTLVMLVCIGGFIAFTVGAILDDDSRLIAGSVVFGIITTVLIFGLIYALQED